MTVAHNTYCVLTATLAELRQTRDVFDADPRFSRLDGSEVAENIFQIKTSKDQVRTVRLSTCGAMGHMSAAVRTGQLIITHQPQMIFLVGTAASMKPQEVQLGDVVIPKKAFNRVYDKVTEKGHKDYDVRVKGDFKEMFFDNTALISDLASHPCEVKALEAVASLPLDVASKLEAGALVNGQAPSITIGDDTITLRSPIVHDDIDIFSCGMVVDSLAYRAFLSSIADVSMRKVGVIDMESYGFFSAIHAAKNTGVGAIAEGLMIRGVSDYAGRKRETETLPQDWKSNAVRNAAIVTRELIKTLVG